MVDCIHVLSFLIFLYNYKPNTWLISFCFVVPQPERVRGTYKLAGVRLSVGWSVGRLVIILCSVTLSLDIIHAPHITLSCPSDHTGDSH